MSSNLTHALAYLDNHKQASGKTIQKAHETLSTCYRARGRTQDINNEALVAAYVSARMPATYAVMNTCFQILSAKFAPSSLLDLGAGPGTAILTALDHWPNLKTATVIENNSSMNHFSKGLLKSLNAETSFEHIQKDILNFSLSNTYDLVTLGYVLGEFNPEQQLKILETAWKATKSFLVITMPGTPHDYQALMFARNFLIQQKGHIIAPCPHNKKCPLEETSNWCHFSIRINRTKSHKYTKQAYLSYEDEKFSYLIVSKNEIKQNSVELLVSP